MFESLWLPQLSRVLSNQLHANLVREKLGKTKIRVWKNRSAFFFCSSFAASLATLFLRIPSSDVREGEMGKQIIQRQTKRNERIKMVNLKASARRMRRTERQFEVFFSLAARSFGFFLFWGECQPHWRCSVDVDDVFSLADEQEEWESTHRRRKKVDIKFNRKLLRRLEKFLIKKFREKVYFFSTLRCRPNQAWTRGKFREENRITNTAEPSSSTSNIVNFSGVRWVAQNKKEKTTRHDDSVCIKSHSELWNLMLWLFFLLSFLCCSPQT